MMVKIVPLLKERDEKLHEQSKAILKHIEEPLNKALQYVMKDDRAVDWFHIELLANDEFLHIRGGTVAKLGEIISNGNENFIADEKYLEENPISDIQLLLPTKVVERCDPEEIFEHIKLFVELKKIMSRDDIISIICTLKIDSLSDIVANTTSVLEKMTRPVEYEGFNIDQLSDIQVSQIRYFTETGSKSKN